MGLNFGNTAISGAYLGSSEVSAVYLGSSLLWSGGRFIDLSWAEVQDIVRRGEAAQYFKAGDLRAETIFDMDLSSTSQYDLEIIGFDKMVAADMEFVRSPSSDSGSALAWTAADGWTIFTASALPAVGDLCYYDPEMTKQTATVVSLNATTLMAAPKHTLTLGFKHCIGAMQFDAAERRWALTADANFHPEYVLRVRNIGDRDDDGIYYYQADKTQTGYDRIWWENRRDREICYSYGLGWVIRSRSSGNIIFYQKDTEEPTSGIWINYTSNSGLDFTITHANGYYKLINGEYTEASEGTDYIAGDVIPADTYYEINPHGGDEGSPRWRDSGIRQYLNASGTDWWRAKHIWDQAPSYSENAGFLDRIPSALNAVVGKTTLTTNSAYFDYSPYDITDDRFFLLSVDEVGLHRDVFQTFSFREGVCLDYYVCGDMNSISHRAKRYRKFLEYDWWLRSCFDANTLYVAGHDNWYAQHMGYYSSSDYGYNRPRNIRYVAPAFNII